ncbi:MAG TPA: LUD domain-containing protein [Pedobacter sp.]|nr:LUD domain-containing protein [Pedobacter sp.]
MSSRVEILERVKHNQPEYRALPENNFIVSSDTGLPGNIEQFRTVLTNIGGALIEVTTYEEIKQYIHQHYKGSQRIISTLPELQELSEQDWKNQDPHSFENVDLAILKAHFGVAENGALWITEDLMQQRVVPFICQQLAIVVNKNEILTTMHEAYFRIGKAEYGFGAFIAGPSKTADIEQSLVLGAHGPKGMTVFLLD